MRPATQCSVIIPWGGETVLIESLSRNRHWFDAASAEVIVVSYTTETHPSELDQRLPVREISPAIFHPERFASSLSQAINFGIQLSHSSTLAILVPSLVLTSDFLEVSNASCSLNAYTTISRVNVAAIDPPRLDTLTQEKSGDSRLLHAWQQSFWRVPTGSPTSERFILSVEDVVSGVRWGLDYLAVDKRHLLTVGGANSVLRGSQLVAADLRFRLQRLCGLSNYQYGTADMVGELYDRSSKSHGQQFSYNESVLLSNYSGELFIGTFLQDIARTSS